MSILAAEEIEIGTHPTVELFGRALNVDTIVGTVIAGAILVGLGLYMARRATRGTPSKLQLAFETVVDGVRRQVEGTIGPTAPFVVPLAVTLFFFILIANWIEIIPSNHHLPAPTADVNLTAALALLVIGWALFTGIRKRGIGGYVKGFTKPYPLMLPINVIEEVARPVSLALRLFGNLFASGIMLSVIGLLPAALLWAPNSVWKLFAMFIGLVQAFIFALLTILYFATAMGEGGH